MAISYTVEAEVVDITTDRPGAEDAFLVDTNVWYWFTYPKAQSFNPSHLSVYPNYLNDALEAKSKVLHSGLSLAELTHIIEKTEREIHERVIDRNVIPKEFRHNLYDKRVGVVSEILAAWGQVAGLSQPLRVTIDPPTVTAALSRLRTERVDGYDLFILESMKSGGVRQIITDDGDFATVRGIQVFTSNRNVIRAATAQGRLLTRR